MIPSDDVPAEVRGAIKHWSQMVDYWAVDWDFKDDTFHNQWQSYGTRKSPKLELSVYGLAAEYVYDNVQKNGTNEKGASSNHLFTVMKGICFIVFAAVGLFFGWFS